MKRKVLLIGALTIALAMLSACKNDPERQSVISKNDGSFDSSIIIQNEIDSNAFSNSYSTYENTFQNTNGTVNFQISLSDHLQYTGALPVVRCSPHYFTIDEVKSLGETLFGQTAEYYEWNLGRKMSKEELEEKLVLWKRYQSDGFLAGLFGTDTHSIEINKDIIDSFIELYGTRKAFEDAPAESQTKPLQWGFTDTGEGDSKICASVLANGVRYYYQAINRDQNDYKLNNISVFIADDTPSPNNLSYFDYIRTKCSSTAPSEKELAKARQNAETIIKTCSFGEWVVDICEPSIIKIGSDTNKAVYSIHVSAVPKYSDIAVTRIPQLSNLKSTEAFAEHYYYSSWDFTFAPDGTLISMYLISPMNIVDTVNENVQVLSFDKIMRLTEDHLKLMDANSFDFIGENGNQYAEVVIDEIELGLSRRKVKDNREEFYYLPTVTVKGNYIIYIDDEPVYDSSTHNNKVSFFTVNAIDGSILDVVNGY